MESSSQMNVFVEAVERGSFSAAARELGLSPSAVSKQVGRLEDRLGVRLLNRSTRNVTLTEEGRVFYEHSVSVREAIAEAESLVTSMSGQVRGPLRVTSTVAFGKSQLLPLLPVFAARHPQLEIRLDLTDRPVRLVDDAVDVAIQFSEQVEDGSAVTRKLARNTRVVCAAPGYVAARGRPLTPAALVEHNCLRISTVETWNDWQFDTAEGSRVLHVTGNFVANSADAVYHAALAGLGIARLSTYLIADDLRAGRLLQLLPDCTQEVGHIQVLYANRRNLAPRVRAFVDFLVEHFQPVPPWERSAASAPARAEPSGANA